MGLEAVVFCDCLERGKLKSPHPFPELVYVAPNGAPEIHSKNDREIEQHDDWMESACRHESMMIDGCRLGSAGGIEFLRDALRRTVRRYARDFPVLWKKVIYSGTHTGDHLSVTDVRRLEEELKLFSKINFGVLNLAAEDLRYRDFRFESLSVDQSSVKSAEANSLLTMVPRLSPYFWRISSSASFTLPAGLFGAFVARFLTST